MHARDSNWTVKRIPCSLKEATEFLNKAVQTQTIPLKRVRFQLTRITESLENQTMLLQNSSALERRVKIEENLCSEFRGLEAGSKDPLVQTSSLKSLLDSIGGPSITVPVAGSKPPEITERAKRPRGRTPVNKVPRKSKKARGVKKEVVE